MKFPSRVSWLILLPFIIFLCVAAVDFSFISKDVPYSEDTTTEFSATVVEVQLSNPNLAGSCTIHTEEYGGKIISPDHAFEEINKEMITFIEPGDMIYFRIPNNELPYLDDLVWTICTLETEDISVLSLAEREAVRVGENRKSFFQSTVLAALSVVAIVYFSTRIIKDGKARKGTNGRIV